MSSRDRVLLLPIVVQDSEMLWQQALSVAARREDTTPAKKKRDVKPAWISSAAGSTSGRSNCSSFASPSISNSCGLGNSQDQACPPSSLSSSRSSCFAGSSSARSEEWRASARRRTHDHAASFEDVGRPPLVHVEEDGESTSSSADDDEVASLRSSIPGRRLWDTRAVYPAGVDKWDNTANCQAALMYECPCGRRCLSKVGDVVRLYEHRRRLRASVGMNVKSGKLRDELRDKLAEHYDESLGTFTQSFVVGGVSGVCERAYAVAAGVSEATYVRARADVTKARPRHAGRTHIKTERVSEARAHLDAWVRAQRNTMEGNKTTGLKWYTEKVTEKQLWARYVKGCDLAQVCMHAAMESGEKHTCSIYTLGAARLPHAQVPTVGSSRLLFEVWKAHSEIVVVKPTGHAICDTCSDIHCERLAIEGLDPERAAELDADAEAHLQFHTKERAYYDDAVLAATHSPHLVTTITIDAPTQHQFDIPSQARWKRDTAKRLDGTNRWQSKVEAALDAGVGMMVYIARVALGGGPNLVCTVLYLTLMTHVALDRPLGRRLHLQIDNTTAENKNHTLIGAVGLLVAWGVFNEAVIFFMPVGHTFNELDAAFSPLITSLLRVAVGTVSALMAFIREFLSGKRIREVSQLHHLWDFDQVMDEHMHPLGGFARTQQSSGMHEFHLALDTQSRVRIHARQSSQSSTWVPEGDGEPVFKTVPNRDEPPPMAKAVKLAHEWRRTDVQTNVRRWLPALGLTCESLNDATREWEEQFGLAVDDVNLLPADKRLVWRTLPLASSCTRMQHPPSTTSAFNRRDMIENPAVNPLHGAQRSSNDVRRELLQHQRAQREEAAADGRDPPLYLAEYLLFWSSKVASERKLLLGRVCGVPAGGGLTPNALVDVVEYRHTAQDGYDGLFGTFEALKNPEYNARTKGSLAFVRHRDVGRDRIQVYNVQMFGSQKDLRICAKSLRALSIALPEQYSMPQVLPPTHQRRIDMDAGEEDADGDEASAIRAENRVGNRRNANAADRPVANGAVIEVYWTEDPVGWFRGRVTSSRREDDTWVTRVVYERCDEWETHAAWHYLDPAHDDAVEWRFAAQSSEAI